MTNFSATVPVKWAGEVNAKLADLGYGPNNFAVPASSAGATMSDYAGLHCWSHPQFQADIEALDPAYGIVVTEGSGTPNFNEACAKEALTWKPYDGTNESLPKTGDLTTYEGKSWVCLADYNPYAPPVNWRESGVNPAWTQPTNAKDAYPLAFSVTHKGKVWQSLIDANTTEPGLDPRWWEDTTPVVDEWPPFEQPTHAGNVYMKGDKVTFEGKHYESAIDNNSWSPTAYPAGWILRP